MKIIQLTQGKVTLVDEADYEELSKHGWFANRSHQTFYAMRKLPSVKGERQVLRMHREILGLGFGDERQADHRDGDGLNNQRHNLRICSHRQNCCNRHTYNHPKYSPYTGVSWRKDRGVWTAQIRADWHLEYLGSFSSESAAALAYNAAATKHFGEFARLNVVESDGI